MYSYYQLKFLVEIECILQLSTNDLEVRLALQKGLATLLPLSPS